MHPVKQPNVRDKSSHETSFKDVYNEEFQDKISKLNDMVANTLNQIKK